MSEIPTIGDVVREWRQYWQISLTDFCQQTKLSKGYVSELEHNKIDNPKKDKLKILAKALRITEMELVSRRMPPKDGVAQSTPSSQQGTVVQGSQKPSSVPMRSMANAAVEIEIPDVLFGTTGEEVDDMIASAGLSKEEYRQVNAAVKEMTRRLLLLIETEHKIQKEG